LFVIPSANTALFTGAAFGACNNLTWGYQLDPPIGAEQDQFTKPYGCFSRTAPNVTISAAATTRSMRVYLRDNTCNITYYSDGTARQGTTILAVDHSIVTPTGPASFNLRFADAGGFCERTLVPLTTFLGYNFTVNLTIGAFPTATGATFVVGDLEAMAPPMIGNQLTWWSSQWANINQMSGGPAPSSMKGFAGFEDMALPPGVNPAALCGMTWTTDPGNSTPPPATVPSNMFVIVSSHIQQNGSVISGDIKEVIVVHNDPGYQPDPGHTGTGTEAAIVCSTP
jgi:hypothetical protein